MEDRWRGGAKEESNAEEGTVENRSHCSSPRKQIADSVVYKLVRVEGDGTLVPATDDDVMEVEHMLKDDKKDAPSIESMEKFQDYVSDAVLSSRKSGINSLEGSSLSESSVGSSQKLNARLEYVEAMLQKVKQEEKLRLSSEPPCQSPRYQHADKQPSAHIFYLPAFKTTQQTERSSREATALSEGIVGRCPEPTEDERSASGMVATEDLSNSYHTEGEIICFDNLTIRELQEAFRATFGRPTSVKDKLWLKRRLSIPLTNSCHVPSTGFATKDRNVAKKSAKEGGHHSADSPRCEEVDSQPVDQSVISSKDGAHDSSPSSQVEERIFLSGKRLRPPGLQNDPKDDGLHAEVSGAKRIRRPTKRYIEESSDVETRECRAPVNSSRENLHSSFTSPGGIDSKHSSFVLRKDFLGGFGVQVPYALRVRRGRPRTSFLTFMEDKSAPEAPYWSSSQDVTGASGGDSDDSGDIVLMPKHNGGERRKHHRAWTLWEVTKLIEGVSKYGAGRWSEIKRLAFPSYTQRTSVDLKDKWRNLLRACFTQRPAENRNTRRHNSAPPIPTWVLARVRELSEMQQAHQRIGGFGSTKAARSMARFKYVGARGSMGVSRDPLAAATTYHRPLHLATLGICSTFNVGLGGFETLGSMKIRLCPSHLQDPESTWSIGGRQP